MPAADGGGRGGSGALELSGASVEEAMEKEDSGIVDVMEAGEEGRGGGRGCVLALDDDSDDEVVGGGRGWGGFGIVEADVGAVEGTDGGGRGRGADETLVANSVE